MFDIGWPELMVIAVIALVVIGPKDLPKAVYGVGKWVRKARMVAREFQTHVDDMMREAELDEIRQQALKARDLNLTRVVEQAVDPDGKLRSAFDDPAPPADTATTAQPVPAVTAQPVPAVEPPAANGPATAPGEAPVVANDGPVDARARVADPATPPQTSAASEPAQSDRAV